MNVSVWLVLSLLNFRHSDHERFVGKLTSEAYRSQLHSVRQIYRVNAGEDPVDLYGGVSLPSITLQGTGSVGWPIENSLLIVETCEGTFRRVMENVLTAIVHAEKILLVINFMSAPITYSSGSIVEHIGRMLFRRGVLNYVVLIDAAVPSTFCMFKFDVRLNHLIRYDANTPFEELFPPFVRSLEGYNMKALFSDNFPYAYNAGKNWEGIDVYLMRLAVDRFRFHVSRTKLDINHGNALDRMESIQTLLEEGMVDIHLPRSHFTRKNTGVGLAPAYEWDSLVLVVPKTDQLNLSHIMLQPFSLEVWTLVCGYLLMKQLFRLLSFLQRHCKRLAKRNRTDVWWSKSFGSVTSVGVELVSFILIEAYLAKITEFLLYSRFKADPQSLDEFVRSDILVVVPAYMDALVATFEPPEVARQLRAKLVRPDEFSRLPASCCARIHTLKRAEYIVRMPKYWSVEFDRRQFYILPGALKTIPMTYLLGRTFHFQNSFEQFILHAYESGLMTRYIESLRQTVALLERDYVSRGWLTLADLFPLILLVISGWCLSLFTFCLEVLFVKANHYRHRNGVNMFKN